jgi:hypothetical protein
VPGSVFTERDAVVLSQALDGKLDRIVSDTLRPVLRTAAKQAGRRKTRAAPPAKDALDAVIDRLSRARTRESDT